MIGRSFSIGPFVEGEVPGLGIALGAFAPADEQSTDAMARWEWRTFFGGSALTSGLQQYVAGPGGAVHPETHILSSVSPHMVKIRDDRLEIKRLECVDDNGLELWRPVLATPFPLDAAAIEAMCDALEIPPPFAPLRSSSMGALLAGVIAPNDTTRIVTLTKQQTPLRVLDCEGEYAEVTIKGMSWLSVAVANANPVRVMSAVSQLGFDSSRNSGYTSTLKRLVAPL